MFPVHTWLADTTEKATTGTSVLLVCVLDKIGTFGMLRFCLGLFPDASVWATPLVVTLALISIVYGALVAIGQDDLLRLIGLTSLSHFGFIVLGIFVFTTQGGAGSVLYMVNHGVGTAALFLIAGYLVQRKGTASIREMTGIEQAAPVLAGLMLVAGLAAAGLPGLAPFISEFMIMIAAFGYGWWVGAIAVSAIVLSAVYILWLYQRAMTGPKPEGLVIEDLNRREIGAVAPLLAALLVFGFYPMPLLDVINPYVEDTLAQVGVSDPSPTVPAEDHRQDCAEGAAVNEFIKPDLDYVRLAPLLIVFGVASPGILVEAFVPRRSRFVLQTGLALIGLAAAFAVTVRVALNLPELGGGAAPRCSHRRSDRLGNRNVGDRRTRRLHVGADPAAGALRRRSLRGAAARRRCVRVRRSGRCVAGHRRGASGGAGSSRPRSSRCSCSPSAA